jgi:hypothetical protein
MLYGRNFLISFLTSALRLSIQGSKNSPKEPVK